MSTLLGNRYELIERIGDGGMAEVYRAHDKMLDRFVAVKILHPQFTSDEAFVKRFRREAQGAAAHPYVHGCAEEAFPAAGQDPVRRFRAHVHRILCPGFLLQPWYA